MHMQWMKHGETDVELVNVHLGDLTGWIQIMSKHFIVEQNRE